MLMTVEQPMMCAILDLTTIEEQVLELGTLFTQNRF